MRELYGKRIGCAMKTAHSDTRRDGTGGRTDIGTTNTGIRFTTAAAFFTARA